MKLLFDNNISCHLVTRLADVFPGCTHIALHGLVDASDEAIWHFARANGFIIVTKDDDFNQRALLRGQPPKIVWLRIGNCSTSDLAALLCAKHVDLLEFAGDRIAAVLALAP